MCQYYDIGDFENAEQTELIVIDANKDLIFIRTNVLSKEYGTGMEYVRQDNTYYHIDQVPEHGDVRLFTFTEDVHLYGTTLFTPNTGPITFPMILSESPTKIEIHRFESPNVAVLYEDGQPKVVAFVSMTEETNELDVKLNKSTTLRVKFDFETNQYLVVP